MHTYTYSLHRHTHTLSHHHSSHTHTHTPTRMHTHTYTHTLTLTHTHPSPHSHPHLHPHPYIHTTSQPMVIAPSVPPQADLLNPSVLAAMNDKCMVHTFLRNTLFFIFLRRSFLSIPFVVAYFFFFLILFLLVFLTFSCSFICFTSPSLPLTTTTFSPPQELSSTRKGRSKVLEAAGAVVNKEEIKDWESIR